MIFYNERIFPTSNERILQRVRSDYLQRATSATSNERILQRVRSNYFQRANYCNE